MTKIQKLLATENTEVFRQDNRIDTDLSVRENNNQLPPALCKRMSKNNLGNKTFIQS